MGNEVVKFKSYIQENNLLWSTERAIIAEQVFENHFHYTADDLYVQLKELGKNISRATVYRTLELLEKSNLVSKIHLENGKHIYEHIYGHTNHGHLVCQNCNKIIEVKSKKIEEMQKKISGEENFKITRHSFKIYGICFECQKRVEEN